jgi:hypothetical protein
MTSHPAQHSGQPAGAAESGTAQLIGYGRLTWDELTSLLGDAQAAWADYTGFHLGPPPAQPPPYTHLWAWTGHWLIRARIDGHDAITGALILTTPPVSAPPAQLSEQVTYQRATAHTWPIGEKRVGPLTPDVADHPVDIYLIPGQHPVTFIAATTPA